MKTLPSWAQWGAYFALRGIAAIPQIAGVQSSLRAVAAVGKAHATSRINQKRLARAESHLELAYPEWTTDQRRQCAISAFQHAFMLAVEAAFSPRLITPYTWHRHVEYLDAGPVLRVMLERRPVMLLTGHCGNWEILGAALCMLGYPISALYRPLDLQPLDNWVRRSRARSGMRLIDKFGALRSLPGILERGEPTAFVADQNGGDRGIFVPFFGRLVSSYKSISLMAIRYQAVIVVGQARRLGWRGGDTAPDLSPAEIERQRLAEGFRFRVEVGDIFGPEDYMNQPDPAYYLTARYRLAIEKMIRSSPWDYFWMHRTWRSRPVHERLNKPFPDSLRRRLESLPWLNDADVAALIDRSDRDRRILAHHGVTRLP
ncbi:MAG: hypothetical protein KF866_09010 [Phycisphaeraceae bacterium]|nr:hypothetical protein [Phycisphaeraceae bacterium]MCW5754018.1 hypothetical protein [Phycisphaeraceae bacterium]